jgi:dTDP-4-amino-4,6-dideoxygalactose transaminase
LLSLAAEGEHKNMERKIPLIDLQRQYKELKEEIDSAIEKVLRRCDFILGEDVELFEQEFAKFCGTKYAVSVSSGTAALELSLRALNISEKDEVIVPTFTYYSTAAVVCYVGAVPVFVDIEETGNIDVEKIEKSITDRTKAIIPVHLYGQPANMEKIMEIAQKYNLPVIEDAAQAHGAVYLYKGNNKKVGSMGTIGCFSFYPSKNLGAYGDGGIVVTDDYNIAERIKLLRDYGRKEKYTHELLGYNMRLDTLQAAILRVKLKKLDLWNDKRRKIASLYNELLKNLPVDTVKIKKEHCTPVYHLYVIRAKERDRLHKYLSEEGVSTGIHYPTPLHLQPCFKFLGYKEGDFVVSERLSREVLSLPMFPELTEDEVMYIYEKIKKFFHL